MSGISHHTQTHRIISPRQSSRGHIITPNCYVIPDLLTLGAPPSLYGQPTAPRVREDPARTQRVRIKSRCFCKKTGNSRGADPGPNEARSFDQRRG